MLLQKSPEINNQLFISKIGIEHQNNRRSFFARSRNGED